MLKATYSCYFLNFKEPGGTSRGILTQKETWFIRIYDPLYPEKPGVGECAVFRGLSSDDRPDYELKLQEVCRNINSLVVQVKQAVESPKGAPRPEQQERVILQLAPEVLQKWSSIRFGVETALASLQNEDGNILFPSPFTEGKAGIETNGLVWMGDKETMRKRITEKLAAGFHCIKLKIGAIDFEAELSLLKEIRSQFSRTDIELRVDANGAFRPDNARSKLEQLSRFGIHSIEQPIRAGQWEEMAHLCRETPLPVALDEELIGIDESGRKEEMLDYIRPQYIILKPALAGGFQGATEWIKLAEERQTGWWVTSALESNIGLNAIAQWTYRLNNPMPQGLGTGQLYTNNFPSALTLEGSELYYKV